MTTRKCTRSLQRMLVMDSISFSPLPFVAPVRVLRLEVGRVRYSSENTSLGLRTRSHTRSSFLTKEFVHDARCCSYICNARIFQRQFSYLTHDSNQHSTYLTASVRKLQESELMEKKWIIVVQNASESSVNRSKQSMSLRILQRCGNPQPR